MSETLPVFARVTLFTDSDGRARWRDEPIVLGEGNPQFRVAPAMACREMQLRESPVGYGGGFHCTPRRQWLFILAGCMEVGLQDGTSRQFRAGEHLYVADTLPEGATFDPALHGHRSRQVGDEPLRTLFVRE